MERDFMGLSSAASVKQEVPDETMDPASTRSSAMQWSFSNKVSAHQQYLSFKGTQEEKPKTGFDSLASTGLVTITTTEVFDSKPYSGSMQNNVMEKAAGTHYTITTYPQRPHEVRALPVSSQTNQTVSVAINAPIQSFVSPGGQNLIGSANVQALGRVSISGSAATLPASRAVVGTTELRNSAKSSGPAQLTIFYAGSVCVYDDISPEKAQAIMLLAGNGHSMTPNTIPPSVPSQAPLLRPTILDSFVVSQTHNKKSSLPSTISVLPHSVSQPVGGSGGTNDMSVMRTLGSVASVSSKKEHPHAVSSLGSTVRPAMIPSAVPQARKASLARFLERRKERVLSSSPYLSKQSPDCGAPESGSKNFSVNSAGSCPLPAAN